MPRRALWPAGHEAGGAEGPRSGGGSGRSQACRWKVTMPLLTLAQTWLKCWKWRLGKGVSSRWLSWLPQTVSAYHQVPLRHCHPGTHPEAGGGALEQRWTLAVFAGKRQRRREGREEPLDDQKVPAWQEYRQLPLSPRGEKSRRMSTMHRGPVGRSRCGRMGSATPWAKG